MKLCLFVVWWNFTITKILPLPTHNPPLRRHITHYFCRLITCAYDSEIWKISISFMHHDTKQTKWIENIWKTFGYVFNYIKIEKRTLVSHFITFLDISLEFKRSFSNMKFNLLHPPRYDLSFINICSLNALFHFAYFRSKNYIAHRCPGLLRFRERCC